MLNAIEKAECRLLLDQAGYDRWTIVESEKKDDQSFALVASDHERIPFWHCEVDGSKEKFWLPPRADDFGALPATLLMHGWTASNATSDEDGEPCATPAEAIAYWLDAKAKAEG